MKTITCLLFGIPALLWSIAARLGLKVGKSWSLVGTITDSPLWLNIERKPFRWDRWSLDFGPTYNGTTHGIVWCLPFASIIGHRRVLN